MKAYSKDILRTIIKEKKRFLSLLVISALGVLVATGLKAGCDDTRNSADAYYKAQHLRDFYIQSTTGFTDEDVDAIAGIDGVSYASGFYEETDYISANDLKYSVMMTTWSDSVDIPYLLEGREPQEAQEIVVTPDFASKLQVGVGDKIEIEHGEISNIKETVFEICGIALNVTNVNNPEGSTAFRSTDSTDYVAYIYFDSLYRKLYTGIGVVMSGSESINTYSKDYKRFLATASEKITSAHKEDDASKWYIFTRENLSGYTNVSSDMDAIDSLSLLFAVVFLVVAMLVSLITMNRMIEENRGLIGTYKALGFRNREIMRKYLIYAFCAVSVGCIVGDVLGYIIFPKILMWFFETMYTIPKYTLGVDVTMAIAVPLLFIVSILATVVGTCLKAFDILPAQLMRPKAPKPGSKVLLERIPCVWNRFSFLNKVTARNVFRYKRRLMMTVIGIVGCTALLVCGFGIKDTVDHLMVHQYDEIVRYDLLSVVDEAKLEAYEKELADSKAQYLPLYMTTVTLKTSDEHTLQTQVYVFDDEADPQDDIMIADSETKEHITLQNEKVYITKNAGVVLGFEAGDSVTIQNAMFRQAEFEVGALVDNYLGNMIYMNKSTYEKQFGAYRENAVMVRSDDAAALADSDYVRTSMITQTLKEEFSTSFWLMDTVVYILIFLSAMLAFVVLFTLSSTNISERERELATIKVLGFFDREVHLYLNKEIVILTLLSVVLGLPAGSVLCGMLTDALKMPSLYFSVYIRPVSYVLSFIITIVFTLMVNLMMNKTMDAIEPAEALKSIE